MAIVSRGQRTGQGARRDEHAYEALADGRTGTEADACARRRDFAEAGGASVAVGMARPVPTLPWRAVCFLSFLLATLMMAPIIANEGVEGLRGDSCCDEHDRG